MSDLRHIPVAHLLPDPDQPRKEFDESVILAMAESIKAIGVQVPLIVFAVEGDNHEASKCATTFFVVDGASRHRAGLVANVPALPCIVLSKRPSPVEILEARLNIDINRSNLKPMERARALSKFIELTGCTLAEASKRSGMSQSLGSKLMALLRLAPDLQQKVNGGWGIERAYVIAAEPDHDKQRALAARVDLTRGERRPKVKGRVPAVEPKPSVSRFLLPDGTAISVQCTKPTLNTVVESLLELLKQLKKAQAESLDLATVISVLRDKAKSAN